jgi:hypothetical protein
VIRGILDRWHGAPNENGYSRVALLSRRMKFPLFHVCAQVDVHSADNWNLVVGLSTRCTVSAYGQRQSICCQSISRKKVSFQRRTHPSDEDNHHS